MVAAATRTKLLHDVPSSPEAGLPAFETTAWSALFAPKATPKLIVDRLVAALNEAFADEHIAKRLQELGSDVPPPAARLRRLSARWSIRDRPMGSAHQSSGLVRRLIIRHEE